MLSNRKAQLGNVILLDFIVVLQTCPDQMLTNEMMSILTPTFDKGELHAETVWEMK